MAAIFRQLPNFLTICNLICGCIGILWVSQGQVHWASYIIWLAIVFDFLDGFSSRLLNAQTSIGKELDSLADMVSFGLLPAFILFHLISESGTSETLPYIAFLIAVFSALRLARFNLDSEQTYSFKGLPTPANALLVSSLVPVKETQAWLPEFLFSGYFLAGMVIFLSFLLISNLKLMALKFADYSWENNKGRYMLIAISLVLIIWLKSFSIPVILILYLILSLLGLQEK